MLYKPVRGVWEVTYACNMHCKHCGSNCGAPLADELTTAEALRLCDELAELGVQALTLSGGEPFLRSDWAQIAARLIAADIATNIISNGWLITAEIITQAMQVGIMNICLSLDGCQATHDFVRRQGSYERSLAAFKLMQKQQMPTGCVTCVNKQNLSELTQLKEVLLQCGVEIWQIQLALPVGNLLQHQELLLMPEDMQVVLDFCEQTIQENQIELCIGDNLGYYTQQYHRVISQTQSCTGLGCGMEWQGCPAGKSVIGIRANGYVCGCLAIRDDRYLEGNVRDTLLRDIWQRPGAFAWNRNLQQKDLAGFCQKCQHGDLCLGGCSAQKVAFGGSVTAENSYCLYRLQKTDN